MPVKILLADKSITIQKVVEMLFSGRDYEVVCVSDGETALSEATRVVPDVALLDVDLPRINGYALAARLKQTSQLARIPVILMMSRDDVYDDAKGRQAGIQDNIAKPFESQELIGKVKKALAAALPRLAELTPRRPDAPAAPTKPKKDAPADIFDIISEAPSHADLMREAAPDEEEAVYEVEPVVEEVEEPMDSEVAKAFPVGAKAVEEMRAGLGLTERKEEPQPEIVTFESLQKALEADQQAEFRPETDRRQKTENRKQEAEFRPKPPSPPPPPVVPRPAQPPVYPPTLPESELRSMAEETISRMAREIFRDMKPPIPKISEETMRRGIEEAVGNIVRELAKEIIERVAWEVIPQLAEVLIKEEIERLKAEP